MKILLSPTKTQQTNMDTGEIKVIFTQESLKIWKVMEDYTQEQLKSILKVSDKIVQTTYSYYHHPRFSKAINLYQGLVYKYLDINTLVEEEVNEYVLILSALYGIVHPNNILAAYRLDYNIKLDINLYTYWKDRITNYLISLNEDIVDLSSKEFTDSFAVDKLGKAYVGVTFLEDGKNKATVAKMYRGKLARYIILNNLQKVEEIKVYNEDGFSYNEELSSEHNFVFIRNKKAI